LTDQADKLTGQKNLLTRKQDGLIRKVSTLSGETVFGYRLAGIMKEKACKSGSEWSNPVDPGESFT